MRGRRPCPLTIQATDTPILEPVARSRRLAWFQVKRARIVLAVAARERAHDVTSRLQFDRATVWRIYRRYEQGGLTKPGYRRLPRHPLDWIGLAQTLRTSASAVSICPTS
jgi:hypothetical protein